MGTMAGWETRRKKQEERELSPEEREALTRLLGEVLDAAPWTSKDAALLRSALEKLRSAP